MNKSRLLGAVCAIFIALGFSNATASSYLFVPYADNLSENGRINRYDAATGDFVDVFITTSSEDQINGLIQGSDGNFLVSSNTSGQIQRFDGSTGNLIDTFIESGTGGLSSPLQMVFGPDGNLYVVNGGEGGSVLRYNGLTGEFIDTFATGFSLPLDLAFGPDGNLYVSDALADTVRRFNGTTGAFIDNFATGIFRPGGIAFGPDNHLYVAAPFDDSIFMFDGTTGNFSYEFGSDGNLNVPTDLTFGPDGSLYVNTRTVDGGSVIRFNGTTREYIDDFVSAGSGGLDLPKRGLMFAEVVPPTNVTIDIKPSKKPGKPNEIDLKKDKNLKVAIVGSIDFDQLQVDPATVLFGPDEASPTRYRGQDYNRDGYSDLVLTFKLKETGIVCGVTEATLTGQTDTDPVIYFTGTDSFTIDECP